MRIHGFEQELLNVICGNYSTGIDLYSLGASLPYNRATNHLVELGIPYNWDTVCE